MLSAIGRPLELVLFFDLPDDVATERMTRRAADEQRTDDTPDAIAKRLSLYHELTEPVVEHYRVTGKVVPLRAERSIGEVHAEIEDALRLLGDVVA
jgi:adenylate kinase